MFKNILVAIDGLEVSERAFVQAVEEARVWNAKLNAVYVIETGLFSSLPTENNVEIMYQILENEGRAVLDKEAQYASGKGIDLATFVRQGHVGSAVIDLAEEIKADLIMVGSHGKSNVDRLLLGSVSTFVVTHSVVTTMVVRT